MRINISAYIRKIFKPKYDTDILKYKEYTDDNAAVQDLIHQTALEIDGETIGYDRIGFTTKGLEYILRQIDYIPSYEYKHSYNDLPALIMFFKHNQDALKALEWYRRDQLHREGDKPAVVRYSRDGEIIEVRYYINGRLHRENNKPSLISYSSLNQNKVNEQWHNNGRLKRSIHYYEDGSIDTDSEYEYDAQWNSVTTTTTYYDNNGNIINTTEDTDYEGGYSEP